VRQHPASPGTCADGTGLPRGTPRGTARLPPRLPVPRASATPFATRGLRPESATRIRDGLCRKPRAKWARQAWCPDRSPGGWHRTPTRSG